MRVSYSATTAPEASPLRPHGDDPAGERLTILEYIIIRRTQIATRELTTTMILQFVTGTQPKRHRAKREQARRRAHRMTIDKSENVGG
jgi:hypothetical protein